MAISGSTSVEASLTSEHQLLNGMNMLIECNTAAFLVFKRLDQGGPPMGLQLSPGDAYNVDGRVVEWVALDIVQTPLGNITYYPGFTLRQLGFSSLPALVPVDVLGQIPSSLAALGVEAVLQAGANLIQKGVLIRYNLGFSGPLVTAADDASYVAIKGHTSGTYWVSAPVGTAFAGSFRLNVGEKLDLVARNADSVVHIASGGWTADSGE